MAGDRFIQLSYGVWSTICEHAEMLEKSHARNVAHIRKTGHFFRFAFAERFFAIEIREFFSKWRARQDSNLQPGRLEAR